MIYGELTADHYEDKVAADPRIDALRGKMEVVENKQFSRDYLDPEKRGDPAAEARGHLCDRSRSGYVVTVDRSHRHCDVTDSSSSTPGP